MSQTAIFDPDALSDEEQESLALMVQVERLPAITEQATFALAAGYRSRAKALIAQIKEKHGPEKKAKRAEWQEKVDAENAELEGPEALLEALNTRIGAWETQQRAAKKVAEARAAQEAKATGVLVPAAPVEMPKVDGLSFMPHYDVVEDVPAGGRMKLIEQVARGWGSPMVLEPNMPMLRDMARQSKGDVRIPGYKVVVTQRPRG